MEVQYFENTLNTGGNGEITARRCNSLINDKIQFVPISTFDISYKNVSYAH